MNAISSNHIPSRIARVSLSAMLCAGVGLLAPAAPASARPPDDVSVASYNSFDIAEYVSQRKQDMARDWVARASELRGAPDLPQ